MRVVTTCSKAGFSDYAYRILDGWHHWKDAELWWYTEGFSLPDTPGVKAIPIDKLQGLQAFKQRYGNYLAPNFLFDVVRFSHKVYAAVDALTDYKGLGVWLDGDCVTHQEITEDYLREKLDGAYMAMFKRKAMYTETGFWIVDCSHEQHQDFLSTWVNWYDSGGFKTLSNWTDCETLDATVRKFERAGVIRTVNLSEGHEDQMHPMPLTELGKRIDHCKGQRKALGYSPEGR